MSAAPAIVVGEDEAYQRQLIAEFLARDWLLEATPHREADSLDRAVDNRNMRLRRKVESDPAKPQAIRTVRGLGYMSVPPSD